MARAGDVIENPVTGEKILFLKTTEDTNGELLQFDVFLKPHKTTPVPHIHLRQDEHIEVIAGRLHLRVDDWKEQKLGPGQKFLIPEDDPHAWWNDDEAEAQVRVEFRPALKMERYFETVFGLAQSGKTNAEGVPNLLQTAVLACEYELLPARMPEFLQRILYAGLSPISRSLGYRAYYTRDNSHA